MSKMSKSLTMVLIAPFLTVTLLAGVMVENSRRIQPADAADYHKRARAAVSGIPKLVGPWAGTDTEVTRAAIMLLRPNTILSRSYVDTRMSQHRKGDAKLLIVQNTDSRDMGAHYPPKCYPAHGQTMVSQVRRDWKVGNMTIPGTEYLFAMPDGVGGEMRQVVYNFMIVPNKGIYPNINGVRAAAEDYQQRHFGAAQFQVVLPAGLSQQERDVIFNELIEPNLSVIETLLSGGSVNEK
jgi:hypothetical protein